MLGLAGGGGDRDLLRTDEGIDGGRFSDVGVADEADLELVV